MSNDVEDDWDAPRCLIYKTYGGGVYDSIARQHIPRNSSVIQSLICYEMSQKGWGPKLYAATEHDRLEEFIDCHTLTDDEAFEPDIRDDMAKAYARFHSLNLPIDKNRHNFIADISRYIRGKNKLIDWLDTANINEEERASFNKLLQYDHTDEHGWLMSVGNSITHRVVMSTNDANYLNRLVRNNTNLKHNQTRCVIIDFDISCYAHRGFDLAGHFIARKPYPNKNDRRLFLTAYANECEAHFNDFDKNGIDSVDNMIRETDFYSLVYLFWLITLSINMAEVFHQTPQLKSFYDSITDSYNQLKESFMAEYPNLGPTRIINLTEST